MLRNWGHWGHREHGVAAEDEAKRAEETARERQVREEAERDKLAIADAWERFPYTENTRGRTKPRLSERTVRDNASHWGTFATWAEEQGIRAVEDITEDHTAAFSRDLRDRMTANRRNKIIFTCSVVCRLPKRFEETRGPFAKVDSYELDPVHRENLEPDEIRQVIGAAPGELRRLSIVATYTGFRLGDCAALQWGDVRMDENGGRVVRKTGKTKKMVRFPMHPGLRAELEHTPARERTGDVCPELADIHRRDSACLSQAHKASLRVLRPGDEGQEQGRSRRRRLGPGVPFVPPFFRHRVRPWRHSPGAGPRVAGAFVARDHPRIRELEDRPGRGQILAALPSMAKALPESTEPTATEGDAPPVEIETERDRLHTTVASLPIVRVRELQAIADTWRE